MRALGPAINLLNLAERGLAQSPEGRIHHVHSMAPSRVPVPELVVGARFLSSWAFNGQPGQIDWRETFYDSMAPATFVLRDVLVHSSAGILQIDGATIVESLSHTAADEHNYDIVDGRVALRRQTITRKSGTHISILAGGKTNYFHSMIEGAARLSILPPHLLARAESVLVTDKAVAQDFVLDRLCLPAHLTRGITTDADSFQVETLIYPWSVNGECDFHPCVAGFFDTISRKIEPAASELPSRVYIDRRGSSLRPLLNEDAVIQELRKLGFVPVRTETLGIADQVRLFRQAEAIVASHGAGLTNIGYCRPGTAVLELFMDANVRWYFRRLAAVRELRYDCLLGRSIDPWEIGTTFTHALRWSISPELVASAAEFMLR